MTYTDWLGQPIEVGTPVLYAVSNSHYAEVVWAEVLEIIPVEPEQRTKRDHPDDVDKPWHQRRVTESHDYWPYGRTFKLKVQPYYQNSDFRSDESVGWGTRGVEYKYSQDLEPGEVKYKRVLPKPVTVKNIEKVTVFPLPEGARGRLETFLDQGVKKANERWAARQ